jgi:hypothetical protein
MDYYKMTKTDDLIQITGLCKDIQYIKEKVTGIEVKLERDYITKEEFDPIKKVVYGLVGLILTGVVGALIGLVIVK